MLNVVPHRRVGGLKASEVKVKGIKSFFAALWASKGGQEGRTHLTTPAAPYLATSISIRTLRNKRSSPVTLIYSQPSSTLHRAVRMALAF